jgi:exopolyphosphatase/pppGpp-phosphohydrolase
MRIGIAEVGSRSLRLMVADFESSGMFKAVRADSFPYGASIDDLQGDDIQSVWSKLDEYRQEIEELFCDRVMIYGTALCRRIAGVTNGSVPSYLRVLSVEEEALASWAAGFMCLRGPTRDRRVTVVDQGGGSTEIVSATWNGTGLNDMSTDSLDVGTHKIMKIYLSSKENYSQLLQELVSDYGTIFKRHAAQSKSVLYLLGGVATKLAWFKVRKDSAEAYQPHRVNDVPLNVAWILDKRTWLDNLYRKDPERARQYVDARSGSEDEAPRVISGSALLLLTSVKLGYQDVRVSGYGVRHGMAFLMVNGLID